MLCANYCLASVFNEQYFVLYFYTKKKLFKNLNEKKLTDNKTFQTEIMPCFNENVEIMNNCFINITNRFRNLLGTQVRYVQGMPQPCNRVKLSLSAVDRMKIKSPIPNRTITKCSSLYVKQISDLTPMFWDTTLFFNTLILSA